MTGRWPLPQSPGVYMIENAANGRFYVGSTRNLQSRWRDHRKALRAGAHWAPEIQEDWNRYGPDAFAFVVLLHTTAENIREAEGRVLAVAAPLPVSYNKASNPHNAMLGRRFTAEQRAKVSAAVRASIERRRAEGRQVGGQYGRKLSEAARTAMSERNRGISPSPAAREKLSRALKGRPHSPEHIAAAAAGWKARRKRSPEKEDE